MRSRRRSRSRSPSISSAATSVRCRSSCSSVCRARGLTLGTAESCTGGLVAGRLTSVPGLERRLPRRRRRLRQRRQGAMLGVPPTLLEAHGAVSAEVAAAMAQGARERLGVDVAVSVTGIAGPGGGTPEKPVGLVFFHARRPDGRAVAALRDPGRARVDPRPLGRRRAPPRAAAAPGLSAPLATRLSAQIRPDGGTPRAVASREAGGRSVRHEHMFALRPTDLLILHGRQTTGNERGGVTR